jgi:hypothetical protein
MAQNKATSNDNLVSILDCLNESLSEVESCNSGNEIDDKNLITEMDTSDSKQSDRQVAPGVNGWDVKWQMKIWLLGVPK